MLLITYQLLLAASFFNHNIMKVVRNCILKLGQESTFQALFSSELLFSTCRFQMSQLIPTTLPQLAPKFYFLVNWVWLGWS